ncbi:DUF3349 domain-containing protein [Rhodococcus tukisamuensis]|uniref:DUF3349 domain-containing protein n=1 Tax=Rhodococcus tukisamuensis TaxID=168276 RepID=A0A1G6WJ33_9NOCA|nr:DUF3349 domain-containing protein [Rhodococcus tukisamuensis]SDD65085.1 Protein of unknown function [Rhodococcus tukisamuensis]
MNRPQFLTSIIGWLRKGYPNGVPEQDYVPLIALLCRRLSDEEVVAVTDALIEQGQAPIDRVEIGVLITRLTDEMPLESDIARVSEHLTTGGWPHEDPSIPS